MSRGRVVLMVVIVSSLAFVAPAFANNYGSAGDFFDGSPLQETQVSEQNDGNMTVVFYMPEAAGTFPYTFAGAQGLVSNYVTMVGSAHAADAQFDGRQNYFCCFAMTHSTDNTAPRNNYSLQDVLVADGQYNVGGLLGWVDCDEAEAIITGVDPNRSCRGSVLRLDYSSEPVTGNFWISNGRVQVAMCHELGHTVGLRHPVGAANGEGFSCMTNPLSTFQRWLTTHDHVHVDANY